MADHPNVAAVRTALDAMNQGDLSSIAPYVADDVVWHYIGGSEPIRGAAGLAAMASDRGFTITAELHDVVGNDDHVVALVNAHATRGDKTLEYRTAEIFHFRDGKVTERWAFSDDTAAIVEFFA